MVNWFDDLPAWSRYLRGHDFRLGVRDDLRMADLTQRLRFSGIKVDTAEDAARWFGPVFCRNADDQKRLVPLLRSWAEAHDHALSLPNVDPPIREAIASYDPVERARRYPWRVSAFVAIVIMSMFVGVYAVLRTPAPVATPGPVRPEDRTLSSQTSESVILPRLWASGAAALLCFSLIAFWQYRQVKRAALVRRLVPRDAREASLSIPIAGLDLFRAGALRSALSELRRHRTIGADWIDANASVAATVAHGGFVQLVHGRRPEVPEHLLLVDLAGANDILEVLADLIADRLRSGQVPIERFNFRGDPRRLRRTGRVNTLTTLDELHAEFPRARVLILSDAGGFGPPDSDQLRGWVQDLQAWSEVAILTPLPLPQWGLRERTLIRRGFFVAHAIPEGVSALARLLSADLSSERATPGSALPPGLDLKFAANPYLWLGDTPPEPRQVTELVDDLRSALDGRAMLYFSALAVFPVVHPKLTVAVGHVLADEDGQPVLSEATLARLCRLPWLREGRIPDWLRLALVKRLQERPEEEARVLAAWTQLLEPVEASEPGASGLKLKVAQRSHPELPDLIAGLIRNRPGPNQEAILLAFLNREKLPELAVELPRSLARMLRQPSPLMNVGVAAIGVAAATVALALGEPITGSVRIWVSELLAMVFDPAMYEADLAAARLLLTPIAFLLSLAALALWYGPAIGKPWRRQAILPAFLGLVLLSIALFVRPDAPTMDRLSVLRHVEYGVILIPAWVLYFVLLGHRNGAGWAPLIVALGFAGEYGAMWLTVPLIAWLAYHHTWTEMRQLLVLVAPALIPSVVLAPNLEGPGAAGMLLALILIALFVSNPLHYRDRSLRASAFGWRHALVLLFPLGAGFSVQLGSAHLIWDPSPTFYLCCVLIGLSRIPLQQVVSYLVPVGVGLQQLSRLGLPRFSHFIFSFHALSELSGLSSALFFLVCARLVSHRVRDAELPSPPIWSLVCLVTLSFIAPMLAIGAKGGSWPLLDPETALFAVPAFVFAAGAISPSLTYFIVAGLVVLSPVLIEYFVIVRRFSFGGLHLEIVSTFPFGIMIAAVLLMPLAMRYRRVALLDDGINFAAGKSI